MEYPVSQNLGSIADHRCSRNTASPSASAQAFQISSSRHSPLILWGQQSYFCHIMQFVTNANGWMSKPAEDLWITHRVSPSLVLVTFQYVVIFTEGHSVLWWIRVLHVELTRHLLLGWCWVDSHACWGDNFPLTVQVKLQVGQHWPPVNTPRKISNGRHSSKKRNRTCDTCYNVCTLVFCSGNTLQSNRN